MRRANSPVSIAAGGSVSALVSVVISETDTPGRVAAVAELLDSAGTVLQRYTSRVLGTIETPSTQVTVPNVIGLNLIDAGNLIIESRLAVGKVTREYSLRPLNEVLRQFPTARTLVVSGSRINLGVSDGPAPAGLASLDAVVWNAPYPYADETGLLWWIVSVVATVKTGTDSFNGRLYFTVWDEALTIAKSDYREFTLSADVLQDYSLEVLLPSSARGLFHQDVSLLGVTGPTIDNETADFTL